MAFRVLFSPKSVEDLEGILEYYLSLNASAAEDIYLALLYKAESLSEMAERGRIVPELLDEGIRKYRELIEGHYRIVYRIAQKQVTIIRIVDSRRLLDMDLE